MQITIRLARITDLYDLLNIECSAFDPNRYDLINKRQYNYLLSKAHADVVLAIINNQICASCIILYRKNASYARLYSLGVLVNFQGKGIGKVILSHVENLIKSKNIMEIRLEARKDNLVLINFYKKLGYVLHGERDSYYPDGISCLKLKKTLKDKR